MIVAGRGNAPCCPSQWQHLWCFKGTSLCRRRFKLISRNLLKKTSSTKKRAKAAIISFEISSQNALLPREPCCKPPPNPLFDCTTNLSSNLSSILFHFNISVILRLDDSAPRFSTDLGQGNKWTALATNHLVKLSKNEKGSRMDSRLEEESAEEKRRILGPATEFLDSRVHSMVLSKASWELLVGALQWAWESAASHWLASLWGHPSAKVLKKQRIRDLRDFISFGSLCCGTLLDPRGRNCSSMLSPPAGTQEGRFEGASDRLADTSDSPHYSFTTGRHIRSSSASHANVSGWET